MAGNLTAQEKKAKERLKQDANLIGDAAEIFSGNKPTGGKLLDKKGKDGKTPPSDFDMLLKLAEENFKSKLGKAGENRPRIKIRKL